MDFLVRKVTEESLEKAENGTVDSWNSEFLATKQAVLIYTCLPSAYITYSIQM